MNPNQKRLHRKLWAFYIIHFSICVPAVIIKGLTWPLAALVGGLFLFLCASIETEKIMLKMIESGIKRIGKE